MTLNCLKAAEPLQGDSFLFTIQFPGFREFLVPICKYLLH